MAERRIHQHSPATGSRDYQSTRAKLNESVASIATLTRERQDLQNEMAAVAELRQRVEQLERERAELQAELSKLGSRQESTPPAAPDKSGRVRELEAQRDDLQKKLNEATRQMNESKPRGQSSSADSKEIANLRARLEIFEARKVPYTQEELALLDKSSPSPRLAANIQPAAAKRSIRELPAGSALLIAEAERAFAAKRFDDAEAKYLEVLDMDKDNPVTLANVAAIQLELGKLEEAEANLNRAIKADGEDPYAQLLMGMVRLRQDRFQDALEPPEKSHLERKYKDALRRLANG